MARKNTKIVLIRLRNPNTGTFYVTKKNTINSTGKMQFRKYDPVTRKHELFREEKI